MKFILNWKINLQLNHFFSSIYDIFNTSAKKYKKHIFEPLSKMERKYEDQKGIPFINKNIEKENEQVVKE